MKKENLTPKLSAPVQRQAMATASTRNGQGSNVVPHDSNEDYIAAGTSMSSLYTTS